MEDSILKPGYSVNPNTILAGRQKAPASEPVAEADAGPLVSEAPGVQETAGETDVQDFNTLKNALIEQYKSQNRSNMATWLGMLEYNAGAASLDIRVDARAQENEINGEKPAILYHFRHGMGIPALQLTITLREVQKSDAAMKKIYTAREKFEFMAAKNPNLEELRSIFGLEVDI